MSDSTTTAKDHTLILWYALAVVIVVDAVGLFAMLLRLWLIVWCAKENLSPICAWMRESFLWP
jgi:hypothetical protein